MNQSKKEDSSSQNLVIVEPGSCMSILGYVVLAMGVVLIIGTVAERPDLFSRLKEDDGGGVFAYFLLMIIVFFWLPYYLITSRKRIIVKDNKFIVESTKKSGAENQNLDDLVWWGTFDGTGNGDESFVIKFKNRKVTLLTMEFASLEDLEQFLELKHPKKRKKNTTLW